MWGNVIERRNIQLMNFRFLILRLSFPVCSVLKWQWYSNPSKIQISNSAYPGRKILRGFWISTRCGIGLVLFDSAVVVLLKTSKSMFAFLPFFPFFLLRQRIEFIYYLVLCLIVPKFVRFFSTFFFSQRQSLCFSWKYLWCLSQWKILVSCAGLSYFIRITCMFW